MRQMPTSSSEGGDDMMDNEMWKCLHSSIVDEKEAYSIKSNKARTFITLISSLGERQLEAMGVEVQEVEKIQGTRTLVNPGLEYKITSTTSDGKSEVAYVFADTSMQRASVHPDGGEPLLLNALRGMSDNLSESDELFSRRLGLAFPTEAVVDTYYPVDEGDISDGRKVFPISGDDIGSTNLCIQSTTRNINTITVELCTISVLVSGAPSYIAMQSVTISQSPDEISKGQYDRAAFTATMVMSYTGTTQLVKDFEMNKFFNVRQLTPFSVDHTSEKPRISEIHLFTDGKHFKAVITHPNNISSQTLHLPVYAMIRNLVEKGTIPETFSVPVGGGNGGSFLETVYTDPSIPMVVLRKALSPTVALFELHSVQGNGGVDQEFVDDIERQNNECVSYPPDSHGMETEEPRDTTPDHYERESPGPLSESSESDTESSESDTESPGFGRESAEFARDSLEGDMESPPPLVRQSHGFDRESPGSRSEPPPESVKQSHGFDRESHVAEPFRHNTPDGGTTSYKPETISYEEYPENVRLAVMRHWNNVR
jgi:hypothetical protein